MRELVAAFEQATGSTLDVREGPPRPGDVVGAFARVGTAHELLGWQAQLSITDGVRDALAWLEVRDETLARR